MKVTQTSSFTIRTKQNWKFINLTFTDQGTSNQRIFSLYSSQREIFSCKLSKLKGRQAQRKCHLYLTCHSHLKLTINKCPSSNSHHKKYPHKGITFAHNQTCNSKNSLSQQQSRAKISMIWYQTWNCKDGLSHNNPELNSAWISISTLLHFIPII